MGQGIPIFLVLQKKLRETEEHTAKNSAMTMVVALSYSARWEIAKAMREIVAEHQANSSEPLRPETITEEVISEHLETNFMPDPDLLIRTGGELRISNYLLWQIAYSELYFCDTYWPDFNEQDLQKAIALLLGSTVQQIQLVYVAKQGFFALFCTQFQHKYSPNGLQKRLFCTAKEPLWVGKSYAFTK